MAQGRHTADIFDSRLHSGTEHGDIHFARNLPINRTGSDVVARFPDNICYRWLLTYGQWFAKGDCWNKHAFFLALFHCSTIAFRKITKEVNMYAVQGPKAMDIVKSLATEDISGLKRFQIVENHIGDVAVKIAKGGYTGENGYEIYCDVKDDSKIEVALEQTAPAFGAKKIDEFDVMAYTLATEAGFYLVTDIDEATPFETGMDWTIDWSKEDFLGKAAVEKLRELPKSQELVGITVDKAFTKVHGGPYGGCVSKQGKQIGRVTKFTYGFTVGKLVGFALVQAGSVQPGDHVTLDWDVDAVIAPDHRFIGK